MIGNHTKSVRALAFIVVSGLGLASSVAVAEDAATAKPVAVKAAPVQPAAKKATTTQATATPPAKPKTDVKKVAVAPSPCKGLDQNTCGGNKVCSWVVPKDPNDKTGKLQEPYCRKIAVVKKSVVKPVAAATGAATATTTAHAQTAAKTAKPATTTPAVTPAIKPPAPLPAQ